MVIDEKLKRELIKSLRENKEEIVFEVNHKITQSIISLFLIQQDLKKANLSIKKAVSLSNLKSINVDDIIISSLWTQAVMCYSRCFTNSTEGFSKLEPKLYFTSERANKIHNDIMSLRNSYLAHRGLNDFEKSFVILKLGKTLNERDYFIPTALKLGHFFTTYKSTIKHIERLERIIGKNLEKKVKKLDNILDVEIYSKVRKAFANKV